MACPSSDRILDYVERRLTPEERNEVEQHVDGCAECRQLIAEMARKTAVEGPRRGNPDAVTTPGSAGARARNEDVIPQRRIGRYLVEKQLGEGGMGAVYIAHDPSLDRRVALKLVHPELATGDGIERFVREGRALAKLDHPNVVSVFDAGRDGDNVYLAMELVEGQSAGDWLHAEKREWRAILRVFVAAARGLAAAHAAGIVHRDVKPDNFLIGNDGIVRVADFGLAANTPAPSTVRDANVDPASRLTDPNAILGTPAFMSPEQWTAGSAIGPATDQFSLCAALRLVLAQIEHPKWIDEVIERGVEIEPADRFPTMAALADALDPDRRTRKKRLIVAAIALPIVAGGITAYALTRPPAVDTFGARCSQVQELAASVWTPTQQSMARGVVIGSGVPWGEDILRKVDRDMQAYKERYVATVTALCSTRPANPEASKIAKSGLDCLVQNHEKLQTIMAAIPKATPERVRRGKVMSGNLAAPEECSNHVLLSANVRAHARSEYAALSKEVAAGVVAARAAEGPAATKAAIAKLQATVEKTRPLEAGLTLEALMALGELSVESDRKLAEAAFREAAALAETLHVDEYRARALGFIVQLVARSPGREKEALGMEEQTRATLKRGDRSGRIEPQLEGGLGAAHLGLGNTTQALEHLRRAYEGTVARAAKNDPKVLPYIDAYGDALVKAGKRTEALALADEAVQIATAVFGTVHPEIGNAYASRVGVRFGTDACDAMEADVAAARTAYGTSRPAEADRLTLTRAMVHCLNRRKDFDGALREWTRYHDEALPDGGKQSIAQRALGRMGVAEAHRNAARIDESRIAYEASIKQFEEATSPRDASVGIPMAGLGELELSAGNVERGIQLLERAYDLLHAAPPADLAKLELTIAKARWDAELDRPRSLELAKKALARYEKIGPERTASKVRSWLETRGVK